MKTILTVLALLIGIGIIVAIFPWSKDIGTEGKGDIDDWLKKQTSNTYLINARREEIWRGIESLRQNASRVEEIRNDLLDAEAELAKKKDEQRKAVSFLQLSVEWIKSHTPNDVLSVNGKTYNYTTVESDIKVRTKQYNDMVRIIVEMEKNVGILRKTIADADDLLQSGFTEFKMKLSDLDVSEIKLTMADQLEQIRERVNDLNLNNLRKNSSGKDFSRYEAEIRDRVGKIDATMKFSISGDQSKVSIVEYGPAASSGLEDAEQIINTYLSATSPVSATQ